MACAAAWLGLFPSSKAGESRDLVSINVRVVQDGVPVDQDLDLTFELWDDPTAGSLLWTEAIAAVPIRAGILQVRLGESQSLAGIFDDAAAGTTDRHLSIKLTSTGVQIVPRIRLTAVPYAHNASTAVVASKIWNASTSTAIDLSDLAAELAGAGLEADGAGNLRIAAAAAGDGLTGGAGSALSVNATDLAGAGLEASAGDLRLAAAAAGNGLTGGAGSALAVGDAGKGVQVNADDVQVDASEIAGNGLAQTAGGGNEHLIEVKADTTTNADEGAAVTVASSGLSIDGDKVDVDFTPSNYTPSAAPAEADDVDDLAAHLKGIDSALTGGGGGGTTLPGVAGGRLTLSGTLSVTFTNTTSGTLYYLPHPGAGNQVALHDGSSTWTYHSIPSTGVAATSGSLSADANYDVYLYDDSGSLTLDLVQWSSDTLRYGTADLEQQDGVHIKEGATTHRYLGTVRTISSSGTKFTDALRQRFVWNFQNSVPVVDYSADLTDSWTDNGNGTYSAIDGGAAAWKHEFVLGVEQGVSAELTVFASEYYVISIALDGTGTPDRTSATAGYGKIYPDTNGLLILHSSYAAQTSGYHYLQGVESTSEAISVTAYGDNGGDAKIQSGMTVQLRR